MKTEPMSFRVADETRDRWEALKTSTGKTAEEALSMLLDIHNQSQSQNITLKSPVLSSAKHNIPAVAKNLQAALDLIATTIFQAEQGAAEIHQQAQISVEAAQTKINTLGNDNINLKAEIKVTHGKISVLERDNRELSLKVGELRDQAETIATLKTAWAAREAEILEQVAAWKSEVASARHVERRYQEVNRELEATKVALTRKEAELTTLANTLAKTEEMLSAEASSRASLETKAAELTAEVRVINNQIITEERRLAEYQELILNLKHSLETERSARVVAEKLHAILQAQIQSVTDSNDKSNEVKKGKPNPFAVSLSNIEPSDEEFQAQRQKKKPQRSQTNG